MGDNFNVYLGKIRRLESRYSFSDFWQLSRPNESFWNCTSRFSTVQTLTMRGSLAHSSMIFKNVLSISSNFLASPGNWLRMSPPTKIPSRYNHLRWVTVHSSMMSLIRARVRSHFWTVFRNGPMNLRTICELKYLKRQK
jgi:hypothetical protein